MSRHLKRAGNKGSLAGQLSSVLRDDAREALSGCLGEGDSSSSGEGIVPCEYYAQKKKVKGKKKEKQPVIEEVEGDTLHEEAVVQKKKKKKKKQRSQRVVAPRSPSHSVSPSEGSSDIDEADLVQLREATSRAPPATPTSHPTSLFTLSAPHLDSANEMRRMFGTIPIEAPRGPTPNIKKSLLITPEPTWPPVSCSGFEVRRSPPTDEYHIHETGEYLKVSKSVKAAIASDDPNRVANLARKHPWHLRAAYQYGVILALTDRKDEAAEVFRRAAHAIAVMLRGTFSLLDTARSRTLPFINEGSDVVYLILQQLMHIHVRTGCLRTAFEVCKLVYNLGEGDPTGMVFNLEYLALRSNNHQWLLAAITQWAEDGSVEAVLPVATYGRALALLRSGDEEGALRSLRRGVVDWPELPSLLDSDLPFMRDSEGSAGVAAKCYAARMKELWEGRAVGLLRRAVEGIDQELVEERCTERDTLLKGWGVGVRPNAVIGVVDEVMAGRDRDRDMLRRHWSQRLNLLPPDVRERLLDLIADSDFTLLSRTSPVLLFLQTLFPWNTLASMLSNVLLTKWREDNPSQAAEWDIELELQRRINGIPR